MIYFHYLSVTVLYFADTLIILLIHSLYSILKIFYCLRSLSKQQSPFNGTKKIKRWKKNDFFQTYQMRDSNSLDELRYRLYNSLTEHTIRRMFRFKLFILYSILQISLKLWLQSIKLYHYKCRNFFYSALSCLEPCYRFSNLVITPK